MFVLLGVSPPPVTPLIVLDTPSRAAVAVVKSPKSVALPVVAIVIYSITFKTVEVVVPPAKIPLVVEAKQAGT